MNEEIADAEVATLEESEQTSHGACDSPTKGEETIPIEADADTISDARLYLIAMEAFFSGFSGEQSMIDADES